jgi:predicted RNA-binding Zn-ribbon protein involved in translation (DUF1610 family)
MRDRQGLSKMFTCPECASEIGHVHVFSEARQRGDINSEGVITDYHSVESISDETIGIECPECGADLRECVREA